MYLGIRDCVEKTFTLNKLLFNSISIQYLFITDNNFNNILKSTNTGLREVA